MRISGPKDVAKTNKKSASSKGAGSGQRFVVGGVGQIGGLSGTNGAHAISNIAPLLATQEVDEKTMQLERAVKHGSNMLDQLDQLKIGLLSGRLSPQVIHRLRSIMAEKGQFEAQDGLKQVLSQIELRAEVELAKLAKQKSKMV